MSVVAFEYDGNERRGLTARCRRVDGSEHVVSASEVVLPPQGDGARYLAAYRAWLGLDPTPEPDMPPMRKHQHKVSQDDLDLSGPIELVALAVKQRAARCRPMGSDRVITLRAGGLWDVFPGEIIVVNPRKQWSYAGHPYLSGEIVSTRLDVAALGLTPLKLEDLGLWSPENHYWGEPEQPLEGWEETIIAHGPRHEYELEQVVPGLGPDDFDWSPIYDAVDLEEAGDHAGARKVLMDLCQADLRCLDAHAHLGNSMFDTRPKEALRHYEVGVGIGELSLGPDFNGLLPWGFIDNRPFLRCLHGFGLCLWRLERFEEAEQVFDRMLWFNPSDNQGARFLINGVRAKMAWRP